jgi:hypothetical protein
VNIIDKEIKRILEQAKEILYKVDAAADDLEGETRFIAMNEMTDFILDWNLLIHNFTSCCIQDYIELE